ncbi:hypothetical protein DER45DRAFT_594899 [Fusarium avenaceum]|nr:hypothetical protein DER45DRAFT_594899 [Fusarium avenaceum]
MAEDQGMAGAAELARPQNANDLSAGRICRVALSLANRTQGWSYTSDESASLGHMVVTNLTQDSELRDLNASISRFSPAFHKEGSRRHHQSRQNKILSIRVRSAKATKRPMSTRSSISKPLSSLRPRAAGMGYHGNPVAVLDMKSDQVRPLDKADVEGKDYFAVEIPRLKNNVPIYIDRPDNTKEFIAEVNLWSMGVRYNLHRLLGDGPQLYVVNA